MADQKEEERKWKKRKLDVGSSKDPGSLKHLESPKHPRSPTHLGSPKHPRSPPPSALDIHSFRLNYPCINVDFMRENMGKFSCTEFMDIDALGCFMEYIFLSIEEYNNMWYGTKGYTMSSEMVSRPLHLNFFASLCKLSKAFWSFNKMKKSKPQDVEEERRDDQKGKNQVKQEQKQVEKSSDEVISTHLQVSDSTNRDSPDSASSTEGVIYNHEVKCGRGFPDIMIRGFNKKYLREKGLDPRDKKIVKKALLHGKLRTTAIIELKDDSVSFSSFLPYIWIKLNI